MLSEIYLCSFLFCVIYAKISNFANNEVNENENSQYIKEEVALYNDQNSANHFLETLPGDPQQDYPTYTEIPSTSFSCEGKVNWRYYADIDTGCQVFHICQSDYAKVSFICPIGSLFNQRYLVCDWWYNVDCSEAVDIYTLTHDFNEQKLSTESTDPDQFDFSFTSSRKRHHSAESSRVTVTNYSERDEKYKYERQ